MKLFLFFKSWSFVLPHTMLKVELYLGIWILKFSINKPALLAGNKIVDFPYFLTSLTTFDRSLENPLSNFL